MAEAGSWHRVAAASDVAEGQALPVRAGERQLALCRVDGALYAFDDVCPHAYALLSQGFIEGDEIECPLHAARFQISTGRCLCPPADRDLETFPVRVDGDEVFVRL